MLYDSICYQRCLLKMSTVKHLAMVWYQMPHERSHNECLFLPMKIPRSDYLKPF